MPLLMIKYLLQGPRDVPLIGDLDRGLDRISVGVGSFWVKMAADEG